MVEINDILQSIYNHEREGIYLKYSVVNIKKAVDCEEELFSLNIYLPKLLRIVLSSDYYQSVSEDVEGQIGVARGYSMEESVKEFLDWVDNNKDYEMLVNGENVRKISDELSVLDEKFRVAHEIIGGVK